MSERVFMLDLASYQKDMTVQQIKQTGAKIAVIKLTESTNYRNPYAESTINKCKQAGIEHIHFYHFQRGITVQQLTSEANYCVSMANQLGYKGSYIFLDAELKDAVPSLDAVRAFYNVVRSNGYRAGFYTYKFMYPKFDKRVFTESDGVWAAAYPLGNKPTCESPNFNYFPSVDNCIAWQFTDNFCGLNVDGSITLTDALENSGNSNVPMPPQRPTDNDAVPTGNEYYNVKLSAIRAKGKLGIYKDEKLTERVRYYDRGTEFNLTGDIYTGSTGATRYKTQSGYWISGNKKYIDPVYYLETRGKIKLKKSVNIYKDVNMTQLVRSYASGTVFNVVGNEMRNDLKRSFKTESGFYITAHKDYVALI